MTRQIAGTLGRFNVIIVIGVFICLGSYFGGRALAHRALEIPGLRPLSRDVWPSSFFVELLFAPRRHRRG